MGLWGAREESGFRGRAKWAACIWPLAATTCAVIRVTLRARAEVPPTRDGLPKCVGKRKGCERGSKGPHVVGCDCRRTTAQCPRNSKHPRGWEAAAIQGQIRVKTAGFAITPRFKKEARPIRERWRRETGREGGGERETDI